MAAEVQPLQPLRLAAGPAPTTPDQRYWARFSSQLQIPSHHSNPITSITTPQIVPSSSLPSQNALDTFAVTSGSLLQIFSSRTRKPLKNITRFDAGNTARSAHIRRDGRVVVAGSDSGLIQVFDTSSRAVLKTWRERKQPVWVTRWRQNGPLTDLMSCGDDQGVRLWDLTEEKSVREFWGHGDYVRAGEWMTSAGGSDAAMIASGSYDKTVRLWDARVGEGKSRGNVMTFAMAAPVEAVLPMPMGTTLLASADSTVAVLDLVAARPLELLRNHQKTVTSLALASHGSRVLTGGLDGHVKVFETTSWKVVAGSKYRSPILSLGMMAEGSAQEDKHLLVGMQSGVLSIKTRLSGQQKAQAKEKEKEMQALVEGRIEEYDMKKSSRRRKKGKMWERNMRGKDYTGEGADIVIDGNARGRLNNLKHHAPWEKALRQGMYEKALDIVLENNNRQAQLTLLTALKHRSALRTALKGRDEVTLLPIIKWLIRAINDPRCAKLTTDIGCLVLDLYSEHMGQSPEVDHAIRVLHERVRKNVELSQQAWSTLGMIEMLGAGG
ncbi:putative small nucleolar ribonucleoprotein complex subunit Utp15 [Rhizodiscina lignyota]|uniref:Small nucleolar ribonucleoprotein complex subunit Utp15 n=1 Tax=Rhizodiscina lignyota TaxID=1504668 RepID=A0A9P4IHB4_9PEZI|nr:putative small nucleolar ribonucleoprotein complex subunit Utp15 [Rhizodiscina lignyota]